MTGRTLLLKDGWVVNEGELYKADVLIQDTTIVSISNKSVSAEYELKISGCFILPGAIDLHVHLREPWNPPSPSNALQETANIVRGGVTTVVDMPNNVPPVIDKKTFNEKWGRFNRYNMWCNWGLYIAMVDSNWKNILDFVHEDKRVIGVKLFLAPSTGGIALKNHSLLPEIIRNVRVPLLVHAEDIAHFKYKPEWHPWEYTSVRPREACWKAFLTVVRSLQSAQTKIHILHVSTAEEINIYTKLPLHLKKVVSLETCPHYLRFSRHDFFHFGYRLVCNPAIKEEQDRKALVRALANHIIYTVGSDHAPHGLLDKYSKKLAGVPGSGHLLLELLEGVSMGLWNLTDITWWIAHHPATLLGLERRGFIREGYFADLVVIEPSPTPPEYIDYVCGWSPYQNNVYSWRIRHVIVNGQIAVLDGELHRPAGKPVYRL